MRSRSCSRSCHSVSVRTVGDLEKLLVSGLTAERRPLYSGAVALIQREGRVEQFAAAGRTAHYADLDGTPVAPEESAAVDAGTLFDLASITKLFVTVALLSVVEEGAL